MSKYADTVKRTRTCYTLVNNKKGITLVALIVTIIILLILAGISIASLTGNGLFEKTRLAKEKQDNAQKLEDSRLEEYEKAIEGDIRGSNSYNENIYDEWTTWLYLAGIENPEKYNQQDILSNEDLMNKVMNNDKAVEYMLKSYNFLMPAICNSKVAIENLAQSTKGKGLVLSDNRWTNTLTESPYVDSILTSLVPTLISNNFEGGTILSSGYISPGDPYKAFNGSNYGEYDGWTAKWSSSSSYLGVKFDSPKKVLKIHFENRSFDSSDSNCRIKTYKIQASNDGNNWTDLTNTITRASSANSMGASEDIILKPENVSNYYYYRIYITDVFTNYVGIGEMKLYGI